MQILGVTVSILGKQDCPLKVDDGRLPLDRAMVRSYRLSIAAMSPTKAVWPKFAMYFRVAVSNAV